MSSKWKYAELDAEHRLALLNNGNKELFDEEVARTKEITDARRELGLDTSAQEKWMDEVGYNYSLSLVDEGTPVSKTGYAKLYLDGKKADTEPSGVKIARYGKPVTTSYISDAKRKIDKAMNLALDKIREEYAARKKAAKDEIYDKYPYLKEQLVNEGASLDGGKIGRMYELLEKELADTYALLDVGLEEALYNTEKKYAGFKNEITMHRKSGTALESLGVIADVLIKKAAIEDGFDYSEIPGMSTRGKAKSAAALKGKSADTDSKASAREKAALAQQSRTTEDEESVTSEKEIIPEEESKKATLSDSLYDNIGAVAKQAYDDPVKAAGAISKMLITNGMPMPDAFKAAFELVSLLVARSSQRVDGVQAAASGV